MNCDWHFGHRKFKALPDFHDIYDDYHIVFERHIVLYFRSVNPNNANVAQSISPAACYRAIQSIYPVQGYPASSEGMKPFLE